MIHPDLLDVNTLIFDMDGTLIRSGDLAVNALRKGLKNFYKRRGVKPPKRTDEQLLSGIGKPSHEFYQALLTEEFRGDWQEFNDLIFAEEKKWMQTHRITFPGALKTLTTLKRRGYTLALVSNCGSRYLQAVLESQKLRDVFDRAVCIGDREGSTKTELVGEMVAELGGPAVVIGDRDYDIEAAHANGLPAVGALYGYGGRDELLGTDTWVEDIRDLAYLFYPLRELAMKFAIQIGKRVQLDRPVVVGLSGPHATVTARLAKLLVTEIADNKIGVSHLILERHRVVSTSADPHDWIATSYPWRRLEDHVLAARKTGKIDTTWNVNKGVGKGTKQPYRGRPGSVVLVEGPFLYGPHQREDFDYSIWVEASNSAVLRILRRHYRDQADWAVKTGTPRKEADEAARLARIAEEAEWQELLKPVADEYRARVNPGEMTEKVVDGNHLERGILLKDL